MRESKVERYQATPEDLEALMKDLVSALAKRLEKHGRGAFIGKMEGQGAVTEEWKELVDACQAGDPAEIRKEAMDVAVAGLWLYFSMQDTPDLVCDDQCPRHWNSGFRCRHKKTLPL